MRRKTHEEFVSEMAERRPLVEVAGTYEKNDTKIAVRCRTCGHEWSATPNNLLRGQGCPECAKAKQRWTHARFVEEMAERRPGIEVAGTYRTALRPVAVRCRTCGCEWSAAPSSLLNGSGCPKCARVRQSERQRKTHARFVEEMAEKGPLIEVLSPYEAVRAPVAVRCRTCGHEWSATPGNLLHGYGCPVCAGVHRWTHDEFVSEMAEANQGIEIVGTYRVSDEPIAVRCRVCGHEWSPKPSNILRGSGCPECARTRKSKTHEEFVSEMAEANQGIEIVGTYRVSDEPVAVRCRTCGHRWSARPNSLLKGHGCPQCANAKMRKTHARFVEQLAEVNQGIEVVGAYENTDTKIAVRCRACGNGWSATPNSLLRGCGCPECARARQRERGMEARIRRMAADGMVSEEDVALLRGWGFPFSDGDRKRS